MIRTATSASFATRRFRMAGAVLALSLGLVGCAGSGGQTNVPKQDLAYPPFGTPAQIGNRPVMDAQAQQQTQQNLENLARNHATQMEQQIDQGGDLNVGQ